jgi:hypothetical protein
LNLIENNLDSRGVSTPNLFEGDVSNRNLLIDSIIEKIQSEEEKDMMFDLLEIERDRLNEEFLKNE